MIALFVASVYLCATESGACRTIESQMSFESVEACQQATSMYMKDSYTEALRRLGFSIRSVTCGPVRTNNDEK